MLKGRGKAVSNNDKRHLRKSESLLLRHQSAFPSAFSSTSLWVGLATKLKTEDYKFASIEKSCKPHDHSLRVSKHSGNRNGEDIIFLARADFPLLIKLLYKTPAAHH